MADSHWEARGGLKHWMTNRPFIAGLVLGLFFGAMLGIGLASGICFASYEFIDAIIPEP